MKKFSFPVEDNFLNSSKNFIQNFSHITISYSENDQHKTFNRYHPKRQIICRLHFTPENEFKIIIYPVLVSALPETGDDFREEVNTAVLKKIIELKNNNTPADIRLCYEKTNGQFLFTTKPCYHKKSCEISRKKFKVTDMGFKNPKKR